MSKKKTTLIIALLLLYLGFFTATITTNPLWHIITCIGGFTFGWGLATKE